MVEKVDIFVYSGTGNTLKVARCIGEAAEAGGTAYEIRMIDKASGPEEYKHAPGRLLGLMAPTIGAIQPVSFFSFILRLPRGNGQKAFLAGTGAWTRVGPVFLPGYVGFGLYLAALFLIIKGYKVVAVAGFGMPHNWTTLIPPYRRKLEEKINEEIPVPAEKFASDILAGKRVFRRIGDLVFTLAIFPLPLLFILVGHLFLAKTMFAGSSCNGCGFCAENCPRGAIKMYGGRSKRPYWTFKCEQCMRCAGFCPMKAVESSTILFVSGLVLFFAMALPVVTGILLLDLFAAYLFCLLFFAAAYAVHYLLNRIPPLNRAFTYLSASHYWRKYRQAGVKAADLSSRR
jgi:ferredoxin